MKPRYEQGQHIWKDVPALMGRYMVSESALVRTVSRKVKTGNGGYRILPERLIKPHYYRQDQLRVTLFDGKKCVNELIYRLVAKAFLPNPENKPTVNHIDGSRKNNHLSNLEWATYSENNKHAVLIGLNDPVKNLPKNHRPIIMLSLKGKRLKKFKSIADAARFVSGFPQPIHDTCNPIKCNKTAYGYKWKFYE